MLLKRLNCQSSQNPVIIATKLNSYMLIITLSLEYNKIITVDRNQLLAKEFCVCVCVCAR